MWAVHREMSQFRSIYKELKWPFTKDLLGSSEVITREGWPPGRTDKTWLSGSQAFLSNCIPKTTQDVTEAVKLHMSRLDYLLNLHHQPTLVRKSGTQRLWKTLLLPLIWACDAWQRVGNPWLCINMPMALIEECIRNVDAKDTFGPWPGCRHPARSLHFLRLPEVSLVKDNQQWRLGIRRRLFTARFLRHGAVSCSYLKLWRVNKVLTI